MVGVIKLFKAGWLFHSMETGIKVGDIMTRNYIFVKPDTDLRKCAKIMTKKKVGSLIVQEKGKLEGIFTERDLIWAVSKKSRRGLSEIKIKDVMRKKVVSIKPSADLVEAVRRFKKKKIRRLPVVENGKIIGMLTSKDILRLDPGLFEMIAQTFKIREETKKLKRRKMAISRGHGICEECGEYGVLFRADAQSLCEKCYENR